jgi:hypothetical protein
MSCAAVGYLIVVVTCAWPARCWMYTIELRLPPRTSEDVCRASCNGRKPRSRPALADDSCPGEGPAGSSPETSCSHRNGVPSSVVAEDVICEPPNSEPREGKQLCVTLPNNWCASLRVPIPLEGCAGDAGIPFNERSPPVQGIGERRLMITGPRPCHREWRQTSDALEDEHGPLPMRDRRRGGRSRVLRGRRVAPQRGARRLDLHSHPSVGR